jgi:hypothetical protein
MDLRREQLHLAPPVQDTAADTHTLTVTDR